MKLNRKLTFKLLTLLVMCGGLILIASSNATPVGATKTCGEIMNEYYTADDAYTNARNSRYFGIPNTCVQACATTPNTPSNPNANANCITDCTITRDTNLASAELDLWLKTGPTTCRQEEINFCQNAAQMLIACNLYFDAIAYNEDPDVQNSLWEQYSACRVASGIDMCY
jgi:hypothetical protein